MSLDVNSPRPRVRDLDSSLESNGNEQELHGKRLIESRSERINVIREEMLMKRKQIDLG
jgi:hypothetical protein